MSTLPSADVLLLVAALLAASGAGVWTLVRLLRAERQQYRATSAAYAELAATKQRADARATQLEAMLAGLPDGVLFIDANLRVRYWTARWLAQSGVPPGLMHLDMPLEALLRAQAEAGEFGLVDVDVAIAQRIDAARALREPTVLERVQPDGRVVELRVTPLAEGGFVVASGDITGRRAMELAQREALRAAERLADQKGAFAATVNHELRTLLHAVVQNLTLLDGPGLTEPQREMAEIARQGGEALLDLIGEVLDLSRMESGGSALQREPYALRPLVNGVLQLFHGQAAKRGMTLALHVAPDVPAFLVGDAGRIRRVTTNLLGNAVKYAQAGAVSLSVDVATDQVSWLRITVRDGGPPVPEAPSGRLSQPFAPLQSTKGGAPGTTISTGTGLGLAICQRLARLMGGTIGHGVSDAGGNIAWIQVPLLAAAAPRATGAETATAPPRMPPGHGVARDVVAANTAGAVRLAPHRRRCLVLLVEDIPVNQVVTATQLRRDGHRVDIAMSGDEAVAMAQRHPYDVILMDLMMPGMSGYQAAGQIRALRGPAGCTRIIALTANTTEADRARCLAAGMQGMISKPVSPADLAQAMQADLALGSAGPVASSGPVASPVPGRHATSLPGDRNAPVRSANPDASELDATRLADIQHDLPAAVFATLSEQCLDDMRERIAALQRALADGNAKAIETEAHALAGMAGSYGLAAFERRMRAVMTAGHANDSTTARLAAGDIQAAYAAAAAALRAWLAPHAA